MKRFVGVLAVALATMAGGVVAQDIGGMDIPIGPMQNVGLSNLNTIAVNNAAENRARTQGPVSQIHRPIAPPPAAMQSLRFTASRTVSDKVVQDVSRSFSGGDPAKAQQFEAALVKEDVLGQFRNLLGKYGYKANDVADVLTAYLVLSWEVVNDGDAMRYPSGVEALHARIQLGLAGNRQLTAMSDAQKQAMSETFGYMAMIAAASRNELQRKGDRESLARLQEGVNTTTRKLGIDLRSVRMTAQGLTPI